MAHFKTLFLLSLLFSVVLVISSRASADNEPGVAQTQDGEQVDHHGGGGWGGGGGGGRWGGGGGGRGWGGGGYGGEGHHCHYPHCEEGVHRDETHQAETDTETETKSGETGSTNTNENGDRHKPYIPKPKHCKHWPHCH